MISRKVILKNTKETIEFVSLAEQCPYTIDISVGRYTIDAKSIIGMLTLGSRQVLTMDVHAANADDFLKTIDRFITV